MIIDSDVIIWSLRGNAKARDTLHAHIPFKVSAVTFIEVVQGMRDRRELQVFLGQLKKWSVAVIQIDRDISSRAMSLIEDYFLSHSLQLADALIAATVLESGETLLTANDKHYKSIKNFKIEKFRP